MAATIIDGKKIADRIKKAVKRDIKNIRARQKGILKLATLRIGDKASSGIYLKTQMRLADELGIKYYIKTLKANTSQKAAEREIAKLNRNKAVTGIIIHTPAPRHIDIERLFAKIAPDKDVEGLNPANIGKLIYPVRDIKDTKRKSKISNGVYGKRVITPCTASACMTLIDCTGVNLRGKEVVIVGHSEIVGKPLSLMLLSRIATTTVCHIGTYEKGLLKNHVQRAEVLIVSVGKPHLIKGNWIRKGAVVIDVGINRYKGTITGDVDFNTAKKKASYITPVPGGVGPLTAVMLMKNLVMLYKAKR